MPDEYPFDRIHTLASVSFPVSLIGERDALFDKVHEIAGRRGGVPAGNSQPVPERMGKPGFETFGTSVAFEAGDANIDGFCRWVRDELGDKGVVAEHDPDMVLHPAERE